MNNFSLKIRRFKIVREQKFGNISVLEVNNLVRKMELDKQLEPYGMVGCSCRQLRPVSRPRISLPFLSFCVLLPCKMPLSCGCMCIC